MRISHIAYLTCAGGWLCLWQPSESETAERGCKATYASISPDVLSFAVVQVGIWGYEGCRECSQKRLVMQSHTAL